ncbi:GNAT family N-acetyltransferase [soil metagenome]
MRAASIEDLDAILAFGAAHVPQHYGPILGRDKAQQQIDLWWTADGMGPAIRRGHVKVALSGDIVVGVAETGRWDGDWVIWKLYVHPDHRGQGVGRELLKSVVEDLPEGTTQVMLEHFAGNHRAGQFYEREGFFHVRTEPSASGDPKAATVWRKHFFATDDHAAPV